MMDAPPLVFPALKPGVVTSLITALPDPFVTHAPLSPQENERAKTLRNPAMLHRFVWGRTLLRGWLGQCLNCAPQEVPLYTHQGRPIVSGSPLAFNIAHGDGHVMIAMTTDGNVGVDLEPIAPVPDPLGVARLVMSRAEVYCLRQLSGPAREQAFLRLWVRREAWLKYQGQGFAGNDRTTDCSEPLPGMTAADGATAQHFWCITAQHGMQIAKPRKLSIPLQMTGMP